MCNIAEKIIQHLDNKEYLNAIAVINDSTSTLELNDNGWDLIQIMFRNISQDVNSENKDLINCCQRILESVASKADAEEIVLEFLYQVEDINSSKFCVLLKLLGIALPRCSQNKKRLIESSLVSIRSFLEEFIISDSEYVSEEEYEEDLNQKLPEIVRVLNCVIDFYSGFVKSVLDQEQEPKLNDMILLLSSRLIQLYDFFLPIEYESWIIPLNEVQLRVLSLVISLIKDPFSLLKFIFPRSSEKESSNQTDHIQSENNDLRAIADFSDLENTLEEVSVYEDDTIISNLGYAVFYYSILSVGEINFITIPKVYNPKFVFLSLVFLTVSFLEKNFNKPIKKGLVFLESLFKLVPNIQLRKQELCFQYHEQILVLLQNVMIYSPIEETRKHALTCFRKYIEIFDYEARYLILFHIHSQVQHSGTLGFLITLIKEYTSYSLDNWINEPHIKYFSGKFLYNLIAKYCFLKNGNKTDIVENADQIISSLNILRFLILKDKENKTNFKNYLENIQNDYLTPLKSLLVSSKEFYFEKLEVCEKQSIVEDNKVDFTVNGQYFEGLTLKQQKDAIFASLNAIDLIDSLLVRVHECIKDAP